MRTTGNTANKIPVVRAIILAAGRSSRAGSPKMLLKFGDKTLIEKVVENVMDSDVESITVVLGEYRNDIQKVIENLPLRIVFNERFETGMLSSVICGIKSLPEDTDASLILPGDFPFIKGNLINTMISSFHEGKGDIIVPVCNGLRGHPLLAGKKYFPEIEKLDAGRGLRMLTEKFSNGVYELETSDEGILRDIDTVDDYKQALNKI